MNPARDGARGGPGRDRRPARPSGGNTYDRRLCDHLAADGWSVCVRGVAGDWPWAGEAARRALAEALEALPDGSVVLVDGLVASAVPEVMVPASRRLRLVVLMHMPIGCRDADDGSLEREGAVLGAAAAVVTTSDWSRGRLLEAYGLDPARVHVARARRRRRRAGGRQRPRPATCCASAR